MVYPVLSWNTVSIVFLGYFGYILRVISWALFYWDILGYCEDYHTGISWDTVSIILLGYPGILWAFLTVIVSCNDILECPIQDVQVAGRVYKLCERHHSLKWVLATSGPITGCTIPLFLCIGAPCSLTLSLNYGILWCWQVLLSNTGTVHWFLAKKCQFVSFHFLYLYSSGCLYMAVWNRFCAHVGRTETVWEISCLLVGNELLCAVCGWLWEANRRLVFVSGLCADCFCLHVIKVKVTMDPGITSSSKQK